MLTVLPVPVGPVTKKFYLFSINKFNKKLVLIESVVGIIKC